jgi:hypothetical protein
LTFSGEPPWAFRRATLGSPLTTEQARRQLGDALANGVEIEGVPPGYAEAPELRRPAHRWRVPVVRGASRRTRMEPMRPVGMRIERTCSFVLLATARLRRLPDRARTGIRAGLERRAAGVPRWPSSRAGAARTVGDGGRYSRPRPPHRDRRLPTATRRIVRARRRSSSDGSSLGARPLFSWGNLSHLQGRLKSVTSRAPQVVP